MSFSLRADGVTTVAERPAHVGWGYGASVLAGQRWRWFGHPGFLLAVAVLAVNDHVLKDRFGTWWTGKLSDVAGLVVVGMAASVLFGARRGGYLVGGAFVVLKTVPGVAELVAPALGGVTRRDPTDLLALVVLPVVGVAVARAERRSPSRCSPPVLMAGAQREDGRRAPRSPVSAAIALIGATLAIFVTTATSCAPGDHVVRIVVEGGTAYAQLDGYAGSSRWARSDDGGDTWRSSKAPATASAASAGPLRSCLADGTCFEAVPGERIRQIDLNGVRSDAYRVDAWAVSGDMSGCGGYDGALESIGIIDIGGREVPIASLGGAGVVVRSQDGDWEQHDVLGAEAPPPKQDPRPAVAGLAANALAVLAVAIIGRARRWPSWGWGVVAAACGFVVYGFFVLAVLTFTVLPVPAVVAALLVAANAGIATAVGRSERRRSPLDPGPPWDWGAVPRPDVPPPPADGSYWQPPPPGPPGASL